jgi:anti-sigma regulatory factor (Ser/Thr protein kinase)
LKAQAPVWHNQAILTEAEVVLHGHLGELKCLVAETARFCREHSLGDEVEFELNLVLEELFTNSVRHGGCAGVENAVRVRLQLRDDGVHMEYSDRGQAFDPLGAPPPDLEASLEERQTGGLGIHLVRQIVRDLVYRREGDWNRITMRRPG